MRYIIKNCDNCYCYDDEENIKDKYWCEFERDNTHFANPCYKSDCLLKQIVEKCKNAQLPLRELKDNKQDIIFQFNKPEKPLADDILNLLEIEECEDV